MRLCEMCGKEITAERIARWNNVVTCSKECSQARSIKKEQEYQRSLQKQRKPAPQEAPLPFPKEFQCRVHVSGKRCTGHVTKKGGMSFCNEHYWFGLFATLRLPVGIGEDAQ